MKHVQEVMISSSVTHTLLFSARQMDKAQQELRHKQCCRSDWFIIKAAPGITLWLKIYSVTCHKQMKVTEFWNPEFNYHTHEYIFQTTSKDFSLICQTSFQGQEVTFTFSAFSPLTFGEPQKFLWAHLGLISLQHRQLRNTKCSYIPW